MIYIDDLINAVKKYNSHADFDMIRLAYEFAENAHRGQKRLNGEEYISHCLGTALIVANNKMDEETVIASLLHDVTDETPMTIEDIRKNFGEEVAHLVAGVSKLGMVKYRGMERYVENLRKMFVSIADDIRIIIIKFADRLHNLRTLDVLPAQKQQRIAREVLEIYAPIADRLGMGGIKQDLEDEALKYVYPEDYKQLVALVRPKREQKERYLTKIRTTLWRYLEEEGIKPLEIESRVKSLYSTYIKMEKKNNMSLDGIYDLVAMRVIVDTITDCYGALGVIHHHWKPLPNRIKDYIAQPKPNNYRSLHTTVFCDRGEIVEFQIRTPEMHRESRLGIAAHWNYNESGKTSKKITKNLDWLQQLLKLEQQTAENTKEYLQSLKLDIFQHRIFVFTPKGDVINLPEGSTMIDFAYHIHSDIGRRCVGAKINDAIVSLDTQLHSGDMAEIITDKHRKFPSSDWLRLVKTQAAKTHIRVQLREERNTRLRA